jgi:hypothetical protein
MPLIYGTDKGSFSMKRLGTTVFAAATLVWGSTAFAADSVNADFDVSLGGARIMKASYAATIDGTQYTASFNAKTVGMSKLFSKIKLNLAAQGKVVDGAIRPQSYSYFRKKNDKTKERGLAFTGAGALKTDGAGYEADIVAAVSKGVIDPLSMVLKLSRSAKPCSGKHRAFDGRDVFDISLSGGGGGGNVVCKITYKPVAGGDVAEGDTAPQRYEITLAPVGAGQGYVPVRITGTSKGAPFEANATSVSVNGTPLSY